MSLAERLLAWYDRDRRDLPWRAKPGEAVDPYRVWLSEIMLQQTTVAVVKTYYRNFIARWPNVGDLANAHLDDVLKAWAGLGYYARARNLHDCAKEITAKHGGVFPSSEDELMALPGIGPYTASAIAAIAFGRRAAAVDGNAERVIARLFAIETPLPHAKPLLRAQALALVPRNRSGDFAQALMDLGATICTPKRAKCPICPWTEDCAGLKRGIADRLPVKKARTAVPIRKGIAFWIEHEGRVLLRRRPDKGLLGGMMEIASTPWAGELPHNPARFAPLIAKWKKSVARVRHTFTHFRLELDVWKAAIIDGGPPDGGQYRWIPLADLDGEALPSVMRKVAAAVGVAPTARPPK